MSSKIRQVYRAHGIRTESLCLGDKGILTKELKRQAHVCFM